VQIKEATYLQLKMKVSGSMLCSTLLFVFVGMSVALPRPQSQLPQIPNIPGAGVIDTFNQWGNGVLTAFSTIANSFANGANSGFQGFGNGVQNLFNGAYNAYNSTAGGLVNSFQGLLGGRPFAAQNNNSTPRPPPSGVISS